jgi:hypothetical protein
MVPIASDRPSRAYRGCGAGASSLSPMATYIAVFAMVLAYTALVAAYLALRTLAKVRRATAMLRSGRAEVTVPLDAITDELERQGESTSALAEQLVDLHEYVDQQCAQTLRSVADAVAPSSDEVGALRNVALVRYDAFDDMSGRLSFSLALLDASADGVVISAIAAHNDTRVYAKGVAAGKGDHELSPEEQQAVKSAMKDKRGGLLSRKAS